MMELFRLMAGDLFFALLMVFAACLMGMAIMDCFVKLLRATSIWLHGWPPAHCDADGDPTGWEPEEELRDGEVRGERERKETP